MAVLKLTCETTEFRCSPPKNNTHIDFFMTDNCLLIKLKDNKDKVITVTEIENCDAIQLAKCILKFQNNE